MILTVSANIIDAKLEKIGQRTNKYKENGREEDNDIQRAV